MCLGGGSPPGTKLSPVHAGTGLKSHWCKEGPCCVKPLWGVLCSRVPSLASQESRLLVEVVEVQMRRGSISMAGGDSHLFWGLLNLVDPNK